MSGNLDFAFGSVKEGTAKAGNTLSTRDLTSSTSVIRITAVEDLGKGTKATAHFGLDPRVLANDAGALGRDELFVGLSGSMGNLRLGSPNSIGLTTFLAGNPFGTGIGGGYGKNALDYSNIRYNRSARYDSPVMSGFSGSLLRSTGDDTAVGGITTVNQPVTEAGLNYANGPLTVAFAHIAQQAHAGNVKTSHNVLAANYKVGMAAIYASVNNGDALARTTTATDTKGFSGGLKYTLGQIDLLAGYNEQKTTAVKEKVAGLRADYNFSKTTAAYAGYEKYDSTTDTADRTIYSIGLRKSF